MNKAFVLGAGLGERLRPLTAQLPKPLIPFFHRPLISHAFEHVLAAGAREIIVNTHHLPERYQEAFPTGEFAGAPLRFRCETPERLETAGGIANVKDLLDDGEPFLVYNGDVLTSLPLDPLLAEHERSGNLVTLALRSSGPALHISLDAASGQILDIHNRLGTGLQGTHLFSGIYVVSPAFFDWLTPGKKESVIPIFLRLIEAGERFGGMVLDEGEWWDLGNRESYLDAHQSPDNGIKRPNAIHHEAIIHSGAILTGINVIGPGAVVEDGAEVEDCVLWPGSRVTQGARLRRCIVRSGVTVSYDGVNADF